MRREFGLQGSKGSAPLLIVLNALLVLLLASCSTRAVAPPRWDTPAPELGRLWDQRSAGTHQCAVLAAAEYMGPPQNRSFTLELFYRHPGSFLLRGRGTLGVEGFRALIVNDSITVRFDRQKRGFSGPADLFPDSSTREMWLLLKAALPWIVGVGPLSEPYRIRTTRQSTRPERLVVERDDATLELEYARYRDDYPFWHLRTIQGRRASAQIRLEVRQQLYNPDLDSALFQLVLPPGTLPLLD